MTLGTRVGRRCLVGGSSEAPVEHLILSLMSLAKDEKKKALKLFPVNALTAGSVRVLKVPALYHEPVDHPVEHRPLVADRLPRHALGLPGAQLSEVLRCLGDNVLVELNRQPPGVLLAYADVKEHYGVWLLVVNVHGGLGEEQCVVCGAGDGDVQSWTGDLTQF